MSFLLLMNYECSLELVGEPCDCHFCLLECTGTFEVMLKGNCGIDSFWLLVPDEQDSLMLEDPISTLKAFFFVRRVGDEFNFPLFISFWSQDWGFYNHEILSYPSIAFCNYPTRYPCFFFLLKILDTPGTCRQWYPRGICTQYIPGTGTVPNLKYPCFIDTWSKRPLKRDSFSPLSLFDGVTFSSFVIATILFCFIYYLFKFCLRLSLLCFCFFFLLLKIRIPEQKEGGEWLGSNGDCSLWRLRKGLCSTKLMLTKGR